MGIQAISIVVVTLIPSLTLLIHLHIYLFTYLQTAPQHETSQSSGIFQNIARRETGL